jgi:hypothetical protein
MVIIDRNTLKQRIDTFIQEKHITPMDEDPTEYFQKHIQQTIHKCNIIIDKHHNKHLIKIKPTVPKLIALISTHRDNNPTRPVIKNIHAPSYKLAKHLNKILTQLVDLPFIYVLPKLRMKWHNI